MDKKTDNSRAGFTLVELVVVIAILGILAGVGYVAYNGYISYAHKGVDMQLIGEIEDAMAVEAQSNIAASGLADSEGSPTAIGNIFLHYPKEADGVNPAVDGAPTIVEGDSNLIKTALESTFGSGYESQMSLTYDGWGEVDGTSGAFQNLGTDGALKIVQGCAATLGKATRGWLATSMLYGLLDDYGANDILHQAGYSDEDISYLKSLASKGKAEGERQNINGNLLILTLAKFTKENSDVMSQYFTVNSEDGQADSYKDASFFQSIEISMSNPDIVPQLAGRYLALGAFVNYLNDPDIKNKFDNMFSSIPEGNFSDIQDDLISAYMDVPKQISDLITSKNLQDKANEYFKTQSETDAKGLVKLADNLNSLQSQLLAGDKSLSKADMFTSEEFNKLFGEISSGNVMITVYSDGSCDVSPKEADPKAE